MFIGCSVVAGNIVFEDPTGQKGVAPQEFNIEHEFYLFSSQNNTFFHQLHMKTNDSLTEHYDTVL